MSERSHRAIGAVLCVERLHEVALFVLIAKVHAVVACPSRAWPPTRRQPVPHGPDRQRVPFHVVDHAVVALATRPR